VTDKTPSQSKRNQDIRARHKAGETIAALALVYGISEQRVHQIVHKSIK
jgi:Mor family transcriptional regulator